MLRPSAPHDGGHVACLVDDSTAGREAVVVADRLVANAGRLTLIVVDSTMTYPLVSAYGDVWVPDAEAIEREIRAWLGQLVGCRPGAEGVLLRGYPLAEVGCWAREHQPDLLVIPARPGGRLRRVLRGDAIGRLHRDACCPVLIGPGAERLAASTMAPAVGAVGFRASPC